MGGTNFTQTFTKEQYNDFFSYFGHQFSQQGTKNNGKSITYVCALVEGHKKQARERRKENKKSHQKNPNFICNGRLKIFINDKEQYKVTSVPHTCGISPFSRYPPIIVKYMQNHLSGLGIVALQQPGATRRTLKKPWLILPSFFSPSLLLSFSLVLFPLHFCLFSPLLLSFSLVSLLFSFCFEILQKIQKKKITLVCLPQVHFSRPLFFLQKKSHPQKITLVCRSQKNRTIFF